MENVLAGNSESSIIAALQALLESLLAHYDDQEAYREAAIPILSQKLNIPSAESAKLNALAEQSYRQVTRLRATQFRFAGTQAKLEAAYMRLVPTATESAVRQGFLWLAFQVQRTMLEYLESGAGTVALAGTKRAVDDNKALVARLAADSENITLTRVEKLLEVLAQKVIGDSPQEYRPSALAGNLIEWAREEVRKSGETDLLSGGRRVNDDDRYIVHLLEPVHKGELNEAYHRFLRLTDQQKGTRLEYLRKTLRSKIKVVARAAPNGFEEFCVAVEALLFPYPQSIEWMRSYTKPIYTNAQQSSIFDNCVTEAAITQRYEKMIGEKSANVIMLELSRAFALAKINKLVDPEMKSFFADVDLHQEFHWPASFAEVKNQL